MRMGRLQSTSAQSHDDYMVMSRLLWEEWTASSIRHESQDCRNGLLVSLRAVDNRDQRHTSPSKFDLLIDGFDGLKLGSFA